MATNEYFNRTVTDAASDESATVEVGTSTFSGEGPQMYLNLNGESVLLSHDDAKALCEAVERVASYFGYFKG